MLLRIFSSSIKHTFSNRITIISNADMTKLSWISQTLWQRRRSWRPGPAENTTQAVRFLGFWLLKFFPYCWLCSILSLFTTSPVGVNHLQGPYCLTQAIVVCAGKIQQIRGNVWRHKTTNTFETAKVQLQDTHLSSYLYKLRTYILWDRSWRL